MSRNQGLRDLPGNVYYDMSIRSQYSAVHNDKSKPLAFFEERGASLIENAEKYTLSILRFQVDTQTLPIWKAETSSPTSTCSTTLLACGCSYSIGCSIFTMFLASGRLISSTNAASFERPAAACGSRYAE